VVKLTYWWNI